MMTSSLARSTFQDFTPLKRLGVFLAMLWGLAFFSHAQELNCTVTVIAPQIGNVDASRFEALEDGIREFINGRRWTNDNFDFEERIECAIKIL